MELSEWYSSSQNKELKQNTQKIVHDAFPEPPRSEVMEWFAHGLRDGHQFRPYLLLALNNALRSSSAVDDTLLRLASMLEILHQASLIVDDMTDEHDERGTGRKALHTKYGYGMAATISHSLVNSAEEQITSSALDSNQKIALYAIGTRARILMTVGQYADVLLTEKPVNISWTERSGAYSRHITKPEPSWHFHLESQGSSRDWSHAKRSS